MILKGKFISSSAILSRKIFISASNRHFSYQLFIAYFVVIFGVLTILSNSYGVDNLVSLEPELFDKMAMGEIKDQGWGGFHLLLSPLYSLLSLLQLSEFRYIFVLLINSLCISGIGYLLYSMLREKSARLALVIALITIFYYPLLYMGVLVMPTIVFTFLVVMIYRTLVDNASSYTLLMLVCLAIFIRPIFFLPGLVVILISVMDNARGRGIRIIVSSLLLLPAVLVISGNGAANFAMTWCNARRVVAVDSSGSELQWYSAPIRHGMNPSDDLLIQAPFSYTGTYISAGLDCLMETPGSLISNLGNVTNLILGPFHPNALTNHPGHNYLLVMGNWLMILTLVGYCTFPLLEKGNYRRMWYRSAAILAALAVTVYLSNPGEQRYLIPYFPILALFGITTWYKLALISIRFVRSRNISLLRLWLIALPLFTLLMVLAGWLLRTHYNSYIRPLQLYRDDNISRIRLIEDIPLELEASRYESLNPKQLLYLPKAERYERIANCSSPYCLEIQSLTAKYLESVQRQTSDRVHYMGSFPGHEFRDEVAATNLLISPGYYKEVNYAIFNLLNKYEHGEYEGDLDLKSFHLLITRYLAYTDSKLIN